MLKYATGPGAASRKYDILSILMAHGFASDKHRQRLVFRFLSLITTRYNWQANELSMGQPEMARLWCVDTRTVKREIARLCQLGWLNVKHPGARGRVAVYKFNLDAVLRDTRTAWDNIGPDIAQRLQPQTLRTETGSVVPLHRTPPQIKEQGAWADICRVLLAEDENLFAAWFAPLSVLEESPDQITVLAPSAFHQSYVRTHLSDRVQRAMARSAPHFRKFVVEI